MTDMITLMNGEQVAVGTWFDGQYGWTNSYRIIDLAVGHGFPMNDDDRAVLEWYRNSGDSDAGASDEELNMLEAATGQGGLSDKATDFMQDLLPEGWVLRWEDGLTLLPAWEDCAADGGGCDVNEGHNGEVFVNPCSDHRPERKIRVTFRRGTSGKGNPVTYSVAVWDLTNEILFRSDEVTLPESPGLMGGEYWFPEAIPNPELRKAAERLVGEFRSVAEGGEV